MADISNFRRAKQSALAAARRRSNARWATFWLILIAFLGAAGIASLLLGALPVRVPGLPVAASGPAVSASFPICGAGRG
jgi:hypothetical protein